MTDCYCDYEPARLYSARVYVARKTYVCDECSRAIAPGTKYERVFGIWDDPTTYLTCARCLDLREYVAAHVPCFCWAHGNVIEDAIATADQYARDAPGLLFGAYRRRALALRQPRIAA
jgi:hypothetical protein